MKIILIGVLCVIIGVVIYFKMPYSPVKKQYWRKVERLADEYKLPINKITEEDLKVLPEVLQTY